MDWFYDLMEPWVHFIPIDTDLGNLRERYDWAEANPDKVKAIAVESTKLAEYLLSAEYMGKVYQELFVDYLGEVVKAYQPEGRSWAECAAQYRKLKVPFQVVSDCNREHCRIHWSKDNTTGYRHTQKNAIAAERA